MNQPPANAVWYCVVVRDSRSTRFQHYRCFWNRHEAETYKLQLQQAGDSMVQPAGTVSIETLPGGELPKRVLS